MTDHDEAHDIAEMAQEWYGTVSDWEACKFGALMSTIISVYLRMNMPEDKWVWWFDQLHRIGLQRTKQGFGGAEREIMGPLH